MSKISVVFSKFNEEIKNYYNNHKYCPNCKSTEYEKTTAGIGYNKDNQLYDTNRVQCKCGWKGIGHDLISYDTLCKEK